LAQDSPDERPADREACALRLDDQGAPRVPSTIDLTLVEHQLLLLDRMACVGTLAAGVVHEVNNPLGYTIANLGFALEELAAVGTELVAADGESEAQLAGRLARSRVAVHAVVDALQEARQGADRVRHLVRDLRTFSRADDDRNGLLDIRRVLESAINVVHNHVSPRARLVKDYGAAPPVEGNEARLAQVFVNLLVNAAEAIAEGDAEHQVVRVLTRTDVEGQCVVEVSDTGEGISADHLPRIFEPFFTTKPLRGTGLGLSVCQHVVGAMGGRINVETREGKGSTFLLTLPGASGGLSARQTSVPPPSKPAAASPARGRVLVVDDEPMMVRAIQRLLEGEHEVFSTTDPVDAVAQVQNGARFDAILCDLMMPAMSGMDVFEAIRRIAPDQARRIVFVTGGAFTPRVQEFLDSVDNARIEKPIERATLRAAIRAQLSS
jgi:signal transduction histidine kinase/CheY-like chemotaxis protein